MIRIKINTETIKSLEPCVDRYANWLKHYKDFDGDIVEFLSLDKITAADKRWVALKVLPRDLIVVFAWDCTFAAAVADAEAAYAAYAAEAAAAVADAEAEAAYDAADAAAYTAVAAAAEAAAYTAAVAVAAAAEAEAAAAVADAEAAAAERERQIDCLIYLVETWGE